MHTAAPALAPPQAYSVLMRHAVEGRMDSFVSSVELEQLWRVWTPLLANYEAHGLAEATHPLAPRTYSKGQPIWQSGEAEECEEERQERGGRAAAAAAREKQDL